MLPAREAKGLDTESYEAGSHKKRSREDSPTNQEDTGIICVRCHTNQEDKLAWIDKVRMQRDLRSIRPRTPERKEPKRKDKQDRTFTLIFEEKPGLRLQHFPLKGLHCQ